MPKLFETNRLNNSWFGTSEPIFLASHQFYQTLPLDQQPLTSINHSNDNFAQILEDSRLYTTVDLGPHSIQNDVLSDHYDQVEQSSSNPENKDSESIKYLSEESLDYIYRESNDKTMIIVQSIPVGATYNDGAQNNSQDEAVVSIEISTKPELCDNITNSGTQEPSASPVPLMMPVSNFSSYRVTSQIVVDGDNDMPSNKAQNNSQDEAVVSIEISTKPELCDNITNSGTQEPSASPVPLMMPVSNFSSYRVTSQIVVDGHNFENENMVDGDNDMPSNNLCRKIINSCSRIFQCFGRQ